LFWKDLLPRMRQAWGELERQGDFRKVERQIQQIEPGDRRWRDHGLRGRQLAFKLAVIRFLQGRYYLLGKSILRKLLDTIDDLLKSILDAVGGGRGILELKDFIKHSIDD
jgi:hypothetical protein